MHLVRGWTILLVVAGGACRAADSPDQDARPPAAVVTRHAPAGELSPEAVTEDWAAFLGPRGDMTSRESPLKLDFGPQGPPLVWEIATGSGYAAPAVSGGKLVFFHRVGDQERVECVAAETGESRWTYGYPSHYEDRYRFGNGPRSSPVIADGLVYTHGVEGPLHCFDLESGRVVWKLNTSTTYDVPQDFFGVGSTPLVVGDLLIVTIGAPNGPCVVALNRRTGKETWRAGDTWRAGYASPVLATLHGKPRVLVFAGSDDDPPTGGLLGIDPADGRVAFRFPFRSRTYASVNASNPVVHDNRVFLSSSYRTGGVQVEIGPDDSVREVWRTRDFGAHFMTPILRDGHLYGISGAGRNDTAMVCLDWSRGTSRWREAPKWPVRKRQDGADRKVDLSIMLGSLLGLPEGFLALGEAGHLAWLTPTPEGYLERTRASLFVADETWTPPVLWHGLLFVCQNKDDTTAGTGPRLLCYSLRGEIPSKQAGE